MQRSNLWGQSEVTQHFSKNCNRRWSSTNDKKLINNLSHILIVIMHALEPWWVRVFQFVTMKFQLRERRESTWTTFSISLRDQFLRQWFLERRITAWYSTTEESVMMMPRRYFYTHLFHFEKVRDIFATAPCYG